MSATMQPVPANELQREAGPDQIVPASRVALSSPYCEFLQEKGGLHSWFAEFLKWRSDLLRERTLTVLQTAPSPSWSLPRDEAVAVLNADLGEAAVEVVASLSSTPFWSGALTCAYRASFEGREVVLQFSRPAFAAAEFAALERSLASFRDEAMEGPPAGPVVTQFRDWTRSGLSAGAGRRLLEAVSEYGGDSVTQFPEPIGRLCSDRLLGYTWLDGEPLSGAVWSGRRELLQKWIETMLEQVCLFSVVDADARLDNLVLTPGGRIGLRVPPRFLAVPPVHVRRMLKYLSSIFAGNVPASAHALLKMSGSESGDDAKMLGALSAVEPDLKVNLAFPVSAAQYENHWRALAVLQPARPLFLDCLHRNLIGAGYIAAQQNTPDDALEQAHWPVLGRLLRARMGDLFTREAASDWLMGSGLLMVEAMRQVSRMVEDFRDDDVSLRVEVASGGSGEGSARHSANRSTVMLIAGGCLLAVLLLSLRWGFALSGVPSAMAAGIGVLAALGLFLVVSRIE